MKYKYLILAVTFIITQQQFSQEIRENGSYSVSQLHNAINNDV